MFDDRYILGLIPKPAYEQQMKWEMEVKKEVKPTNVKIAEYCQQELEFWHSQGKTVPQRELEPAKPLTDKQEQMLKTLKEDAEFRKKQYDEGKWIPTIHEPTTYRIK